VPAPLGQERERLARQRAGLGFRAPHARTHGPRLPCRRLAGCQAVDAARVGGHVQPPVRDGQAARVAFDLGGPAGVLRRDAPLAALDEHLAGPHGARGHGAGATTVRRFARGEPVGLAAPARTVEEQVVGDVDRQPRSAHELVPKPLFRPLGTAGLLVVEETPVGTVKRRRHGASCRYQQDIPAQSQVALGRYSRDCVGGGVGLRHVLQRRIVRPDDLPHVGVQRIDDHALGGPHAGRRVDDAVVDEHAAAQRAPRDHASVAENHLLGPGRVEAPDEFPGACVETIEVTVVRGDVGAAFVDIGRETHRPPRRETPAHLPPLSVESVDGIVGRGAEVEQPVGHHRHGCVIEGHAMGLMDRIRPGGPGVAIRLVHPVPMQREGQRLLHGPRAGRIPPVARPVLRRNPRRGETEGKSRDEQPSGNQRPVRHLSASRVGISYFRMYRGFPFTVEKLQVNLQHDRVPLPREACQGGYCLTRTTL